MIFPINNPKREEGGLAILYGNLAPDGAVVKQSGVKESMLKFIGKAKVFEKMEDANQAVTNGEIEKGTVIVIRYEGPKGGPGMREQHMVTSLIVGKKMDEDCALITDGRFSGSTRGPCVGYISPEAAALGPIAAIEDGDRILIDIPNRIISLLDLNDAQIQDRLSRITPIQNKAVPGLRRYSNIVGSACNGAVLNSD